MHTYPKNSDQSTLNTVTGSGWRGSNTNNRALIQMRQNNARSNHGTGVGAKLMSIASDLRKNILPKQHEQINEIYKQRISNYLSLLAIHGEPNQHIVNNIFKAS